MCLYINFEVLPLLTCTDITPLSFYTDIQCGPIEATCHMIYLISITLHCTPTNSPYYHMYVKCVRVSTSNLCVTIPMYYICNTTGHVLHVWHNWPCITCVAQLAMYYMCGTTRHVLHVWHNWPCITCCIQ